MLVKESINVLELHEIVVLENEKIMADQVWCNLRQSKTQMLCNHIIEYQHVNGPKLRTPL